MQQSKYIFIDIDGTLFSHKNGIPFSAMDAIDQARKNGHKVFICTGRVYSAVDDYLRFFPFDGYIYGAGGHIVLRDQTQLHNHALSEKQLNQLIELCNKYHLDYVLEGTDLSYYTPKCSHFFKTKHELEALDSEAVMRHLVPDFRMKDVSEFKQHPCDINKLSIIYSQNYNTQPLQNDLPKEFQLITYKDCAEIIIKGIDKSYGMKTVLNYFNIPIEDSIALGDSMNDYEMLRDAKIGIAMGNASSAVKEIADFVTKDVDDDGVYYAFKHFNLIK